MSYLQIDSNNNCMKISNERQDITDLEIGAEIKWKVDVRRNNVISTIFTDEMTANEKVVKFYDNLSELKVTTENNIKTIRLKTQTELKEEKFKKLRSEMMNNIALRELRNAMTFQVVVEGQGSNPNNKVFTKKQISDWGDYFGVIAKDGQSLEGLTLDEINPSIFGIMPELPDAYKGLM